MKACDKSYGYHHYAILVSKYVHLTLWVLIFIIIIIMHLFQHVVVVAFDDAQCFQNSASIPQLSPPHSMENPFPESKNHYAGKEVSKCVHLTLWVFNYCFASFPTCCCL